MKINRTISLFLAAVGILSLSAGCTKDDVQQKPDQEQEKKPVPAIELSEQSVLLTKDNLEATYQFKVSDYTDGMPAVESTADWLTILEVVKGKGGENFQSFQFKMTAALREGLSSTEVKVTYKNAEKKVFKVELDNRPLPVIVDANDYHHLNLDGEEDFSYTFSITNYTDGMPTLESTADWLVIGDVKKIDPLDNPDSFEVNFSATASENPRSAEVKITYKNAEQKQILVDQNNLPQPTIMVSGRYGYGLDLGIKGGEAIYKFGIRDYSGGNPTMQKSAGDDWLTVGELEKVEAVDGIQYFQFKLKAGPTDVYDHEATVSLNYKNAFVRNIVVKQYSVG